MTTIEIYIPGTQVLISGIPAVIESTTITKWGVEYKLSWWDERNYRGLLVHESEFSVVDDTHKVKVGFANAKTK